MLLNSGERQEVELISYSSRGFMVSFLLQNMLDVLVSVPYVAIRFSDFSTEMLISFLIGIIWLINWFSTIPKTEWKMEVLRF